MGVPTLTMLGDRHASRMAASVLHRVGLDDFVARDVDRFVNLAAGWSGRIAELSALRAGLRERMRLSPLCDGTAYARSVESEYRRMWEKWCKSHEK